ncbi:MAG TPA: hypothetical protein PK573_13425 [Spirochaetota bacterium]|nr:hypothetical protein [Spirochaetota bacterium]HRZ26932.1 hypothetical protein [Spirochaetota bacterium]HSA15925.1 hypothetical protein [Spirochaetota bacterium]
MIIHKNFMTSQRNMNPYQGFLKHEHKHGARVFVRSKSDQIEISDEAQKLFETRHVIELEKARNMKLAGEYLAAVMDGFGRDGDLRNVIRLERIALARNRIAAGELIFEGNEVIGKTAEAVYAFL